MAQSRRTVFSEMINNRIRRSVSKRGDELEDAIHAKERWALEKLEQIKAGNQASESEYQDEAETYEKLAARRHSSPEM